MDSPILTLGPKKLHSYKKAGIFKSIFFSGPQKLLTLKSDIFQLEALQIFGPILYLRCEIKNLKT